MSLVSARITDDLEAAVRDLAGPGGSVSDFVREAIANEVQRRKTVKTAYGRPLSINEVARRVDQCRDDLSRELGAVTTQLREIQALLQTAELAGALQALIAQHRSKA